MNKCKICRKDIDKSSYSNAMLCSSECFTENYWQELIANFDDNNAVINGIVYYIGPEVDDNAAYRGFDGRLFKIKFDDGRIVETTNLWVNGTPPEHLKNLLPNNAVFLNPYEDKLPY